MNFMTYIADPVNRRNIAKFAYTVNKIDAIKNLRSMFYMDGTTTGWDAPVTQLPTGDPFVPWARPAVKHTPRLDFIGLALAQFVVIGCMAQYPEDTFGIAAEVKASSITPLGDLLRKKMDEQAALDRAKGDHYEGDAWGSWSERDTGVRLSDDPYY